MHQTILCASLGRCATMTGQIWVEYELKCFCLEGDVQIVMQKCQCF